METDKPNELKLIDQILAPMPRTHNVWSTVIELSPYFQLRT